jgi:hypothetical protein
MVDDFADNPTQRHFLQDLRDSISPFDAADLLAIAAGLQLLPINAERTLRLEALAHTCGTLPIAPGRPHISPHRLRSLLAEDHGLDMVAEGEDPYPGPFVEEVAFYGGGFAVFPGLTAEATFVFKTLCNCFFQQRHPFMPIVGHLFELIKGTLALSNAIADRASLKRTDDPISAPGGAVVIPDAYRLSTLKNAVTFETAEMESFYGIAQGGRTRWEILTCPLGSLELSSFDVDSGPLLLAPIIHAGSAFIVSCPEALLSALNLHIVRIAIESGVGDWLADAYRKGVTATVDKCFMILDCMPLDWDSPNTEVIHGTSERLYACDTDKLVFVIVATDNLEHFDVETVVGSVHNQQALASSLETRFAKAEGEIYSSMPWANGLLCVFIYQGVGQSHVMGFGTVGAACLFQIFPASEFETFATLEAGDPLSLWRFVRDSSQIRETTIIQSASILDEFGFYRSHHYGYYAGDEQKPNFITLAADFSGTLRREVIAKRDWHPVPNYDGKTTTMVTTLHGTRNIPIYIQDPLWGEEAAAFVDGLPFPIWVIAPERSRASQQHRAYAELINALAYWLWQCQTFLQSEFSRSIPEKRSVTIQLNFGARDEWRQESPEAVTGSMKAWFDVKLDHTRSEVRLDFLPGSSAIFRTADNEGERQMLHAALIGLRALFGFESNISESQIDEVISQRAPLGPKKMFLMIDGNQNPTLDPRDIPPFHSIPHGDIDAVLDRIGEFLTGNRNLAVGPIRKEDRNSVLHDAVNFCVSQLESYVRCMSSVGLLEYLLERNEATVRADALQKLLMPTRLACFAEVGDVVEEIKEDMAKVVQSGLAGRFLVEYVAAQPPSGLRKICLLAYSEMRALVEQIITFGMSSDAVHYDLTDLDLAILPSGRLGRSEQGFRTAQEAHVTQITGERIARVAARYDQYWSNPSGRRGNEPELVQKLNDASTAEFGFSMTDVGVFLRTVRQIGVEEGHGIALRPLEHLSQVIALRLKWPDEKVAEAIGLFSLAQRSTYMTPVPPYPKVDLFPWRYNRGAAYLRRPIILRTVDDTTEALWGNRHVEMTIDNLLSLCLNGQLKAQSLEMRQFIGALRHEQGEKFNDRVADLLATYTNLTVRRRVKKVGKLRFDNLGDIDVLVGRAESRHLFVIECKDFSASRTPHELANEVEEFVRGKDGKNSIVQKHQARTKWIEEHLTETLQLLRLSPQGNWKVQPIIVVDEPMLSARLLDLNIPLMTVHQIERLGLRGVL